MPGPLPSENPRRRNKRPSPPVNVPPGAYAGWTPKLPNARRYSKRTQSWYETWRKCEQAGMFTTTAWLTLWMLADLVEVYFEKPQASTWAQIKAAQGGLLALPAEQRKAGFKVEPPKLPAVVSRGKASKVSSLDERRRRLIADAS